MILLQVCHKYIIIIKLLLENIYFPNVSGSTKCLINLIVDISQGYWSDQDVHCDQHQGAKSGFGDERK